MNHEATGKSEITSLGLIAAIAESWIWFLVVPVATAMCIYVLLGLLASDYRSIAILRVDQTVALLTSPHVLRATIEERDMRAELGPTMDDAMSKLSRQISINTLTTGVTQVSVVGKDAGRAQATLKALIKNFALQVAPRGQEREEIERQIAARSANVKQLQEYAQTLIEEEQNTAARTREPNEAALGFLALVNDVQAKQDEVISLQRSLEGLTQSDILQEPTLADKAEASKRTVFSLLAAIAAGLVVLFVVLINEVIRHARNDPLTLPDLKRIRNAFRLSKPPSA